LNDGLVVTEKHNAFRCPLGILGIDVSALKTVVKYVLAFDLASE
jgi:hypothetical protein